MKNILLVLCFVIFKQSNLFAQTLKISIGIDKIEVKPNDDDKTLARAQHRILKASVIEGSGDYSYAWGSTSEYSIMGDKASSQIKTAFNEEDITYRVFVKDNKTGQIGYNTINFKKLLAAKSDVNLIVYPNPTSDNLTISLDGDETLKAPVRVELFSDKSTFAIKSVPKEQLAAKKYEISTIGLPQGVYYVHVQYANDSKPKEVRVVINH